MNILKIFLLGLAAMSLGACASITKGSSQNIAVNSNPSGADCALSRKGVQIAWVSPTPGIVTIDKSSSDIVIDCALEGHKPAKHIVASQAEAMTAGNIIFGGVVGLAIDAGSGAINKYPSNVMVVMQQGDPSAAPILAGAPQAPTRARKVATGRNLQNEPDPDGDRPIEPLKKKEYPLPKPEEMTAAERMELQAGPGHRNYPRRTTGYY